MVVKSSLGSELERHSNPSCSHLYLTFVRQELDGRLLASRRPNQNFVPSRVREWFGKFRSRNGGTNWTMLFKE